MGLLPIALKKFKKSAKQNFVGLPLFGALSPEEQDKVIRFDDNGGQLRMVAFCTNVAETSLTVLNTNLVINSGLQKIQNSIQPEELQ